MLNQKTLVVYDRDLTQTDFSKIKGSISRDSDVTLLPLDHEGYHECILENFKNDVSHLNSIEFVDGLEQIHEKNTLDFKKWVSSFPSKIRNLKISNSRLEDHFDVSISNRSSLLWLTRLQERNPLICPNWSNWIKVQTVFEASKLSEYEKCIVFIRSRLLRNSVLKSIKCFEVNPNSVLILNRHRKWAFLFPSVEDRKRGETRNIVVDSISAFKSVLGFWRRYKSSKACLCTGVRSNIANCRRMLISYAPSADAEAKESGVFKSSYLKELQDVAFAAADENKLLAVFWVVPNASKNYDQCINEIVEFQEEGYDFMVVENFLKPSDFIRVIGLYFKFAIKATLMEASVIGAAIEKKLLQPHQVELFRSIWFESLRTGLIVESLLTYVAFTRMASVMKNECQILYSSEFQSWEYALNVAIDHHPQLTTIAAIQGNPSNNYFQYAFAKGENGHSAGYPDICVSYSTCFEGIKNLENVRFYNATAYRLLHISELLRSAETRSSDNVSEPRIGIIGSGTYEECFTVLELLAASLPEKYNSQNPVQIAYRVHPVLGFEKIEDYVQQRMSNLVELVRASGTMERFLFSNDWVVASNTTAAIEALAAHCEVISPRFYGSVPLCPLEGTNAPYWRVTSVESMLDTFHKLSSGKRLNQNGEAQAFIKNYINLDPDFTEWKHLFSA